MQKLSFGIIAALLSVLLPELCFAADEYRGIIPEKLAWVVDSIVEQWTKTKDSDSGTIEHTLFSRYGNKDSNRNLTPVEERYNRQLVISLIFFNLSSETYQIDPSSRLETSIASIKNYAVPTDKMVIAPNAQASKCSFVLKMNDSVFNETFDKFYTIDNILVNPVCEKFLIKDSKGNSILDSFQTPAAAILQTPSIVVNVLFFPESDSGFTVKDALLLFNKLQNLLTKNDKADSFPFKIENNQIASVLSVPNSSNYKIGFSNDDFGWLLLFLFNDEPVDNDKTAEILSKALRPKDAFMVGIAPVNILNEYFPDDDTKILRVFRKCIEKLPESVAPKRYQIVNIKCIEEMEDPFKTLLEFAESGDNEALEVIYDVYDPNLQGGIINEKFPDQKSFFQWLKQLADKGNSQAQLYVGDCFNFGKGVTEDIDNALKYYKMAAEQDVTEAMVSYANNLYDKDKIKYLDEVIEWLRMAAERKNSRGQYWLAVTLLGTNDEENIREGMLWLQQASFDGYPNAMYRLSLEYYLGRRIPRDDKKAFALMEKAALEKNLAKAFDMLGDFYMRGIGVKSDLKKAVICYRVGAENKIPNSMFWYGRVLCDGFNDVEKDVPKGYMLIKEAAEMGNTDAMKHIGLDYYYGGIAKKNEKEAFKWIEKAYIGGDWYAIALLGDFYMFGVGVKADREKAIELYKIAADKEIPFGIFRWGQYLYEQKGEDAQLGLDYIKKAAKMGVITAQDYLNKLEGSSAGNDDSQTDNNPNDVDDDIVDLDEEDE